jgi:ABC-type dipeptide/oligopeptide/nickel transport system permease component
MVPNVAPTTTSTGALTDIALFIAVYIGVFTTVYAVGEPKTKGDKVARTVALWMCAVAGVLLIIWLAIAIFIRVGILHVAS